MAQALYRKWRPATFDEVVGQEHVTTTLKNQIASGRIGHAYLFVGSRGCGKTTTARIFAKEVNLAGLPHDDPRARQIAEAITEGRALDVIEIDAASHTSVDDVREIRDRVNFQPSELRYKVYIIDEVHMLSTAAFNALLKTLEEPPPHVIFILATTDPQKIPATVLSRCQRFNFRRVPVDKIVARLRHLCDAEGIEADEAALRLIARHATGSLRDAVSLLDQLASSNSMRITPEDVREALGAADAALVHTMLEGLAARDAAKGLNAIQTALDHGADARQVARQLLDALRALVQLKAGARATPLEFSEAERVVLEQLVQRFDLPTLTRAMRAFSNALNEMRQIAEPQLSLELAYLECIVPTAEGDTPRSHIEPSVKQKQGALPTPSRSAAGATSKLAAPLATTPAQLASQWRLVKDEMSRRDKLVASLVNSCKVQAVVSNVFHLVATSPIVQDRLQAPRARALLIEVLNEVFKGEYDFIVHVQGSAPPTDEDALLSRKVGELGGRMRTSEHTQSEAIEQE
ncbi:MAG: DNA polymerase III subunit gamma/tau [Anaerolineae bacterium]|nr:DNA polymerase III subunit gamma/tau [Thermoflexales bacterium]MDW8054580.1 DNA polymerase III subunit gamma/tau [Anaerolineae bacterium]